MRYRVLGPLQVVGDDGRAVVLAGRQQRIVLATLLLHANQPVSASVLVDRLWPDGAPASAGGALRVLLSQLRRAIEDGAGTRLTRGGATGWLLRVEPGEVDADEFERLVGAGDEACGRGDPAQAAACWREALALWRGPALDAIADELDDARAAATRWEELRLLTLERGAEVELALGRHLQQLPELERLVAEHPYRERLVGALMLALYRSGRQADALRAYDEARVRMRDELGISPGRALVDLHGAILRQDASLDEAAPAAPSPGPPAGSPGSLSPPGPAVAAGPLPLPHPLVVAIERGPLLGREAALTWWDAIWARAAGGHTEIAVLSGPAGIGKSRFAAEASARAHAAGARIVFGRCDLDAVVAYQPFVEALRDHLRHGAAPAGLLQGVAMPPELLALVPELVPLAGEQPAAVDAPDERFWLFEAVADVLRALARANPMVVVIDDLHWADAPSVSLLRHLGRRLVDAPLVLLTTFRDNELADEHPVRLAVADLERDGRLARLPLAGLPPEEASALVRHVWPAHQEAPTPAAVARACRLAEGNPFFLRQIGRHLADHGSDAAALPEEVQLLLQRRLSALAPAALDVLVTASVIGREFDFHHLVKVMDADEDQLIDVIDDAVTAHILVEGGDDPDNFSFSHALLREACYRRLTPRRRAAVHARVGRALEDDPAPASLAMIARHYARAGRELRPRARHFAVQAADYAMAVLAFEEAVDLYTQAGDLMDGTEEPEERIDVLLALGQARTRSGDPSGAREVLGTALDLARRAGSRRRFGEAALAYGGEWGIDRALFEVHLPILEEAVTMVGTDEGDEAGDPTLVALLVARLAAATFHLRGADVARPLAARANQLAERCRDPAAITMARHAEHLVQLVDGSPQARRAVAAEQLDAARLVGSVGINEALWNTIVDVIERGRPYEVDDAVRAYQQQTERSRRAVDQWWTVVFESALAAFRGDLDRALDAAERAADRGVEFGQEDAVRVLAGQLFLVRWLQGRAGELRDATAAFLEREPDIVAWRCALALIDGEAGDVERARATLSPLAAGGLDHLVRDSMWTGTLLLAAEAVALAGYAELAPPLEALLAPRRGRHVALGQAFVVLGPVDRLLGALAATRGDLAAADRHLEAGIRLSAEAASAPYRLLGMAAAADVAARRGDRDRAALLLEAVTVEAADRHLGLVAARAATVADRLSLGTAR